jgi:hypothetical protein
MRRFAGLSAIVLAVALVAPVAAAGQSSTYHSVITGGVFRCGTVVKASPYDEVTGIWTFNLSAAKTATVTMNVSYDGRHHASFGLSQGVVADTGLSATFLGGAGTATVAGGAFTWEVGLGRACRTDPDDPSYDNLTYFGEARD